MTRPLVVFPTKFVAGVTSGDPTTWLTPDPDKKKVPYEIDVRDGAALRSNYTTDAHAVAYHIPGRPSCPRLVVHFLKDYQRNGAAPVMGWMFVDFDLPEHRTWHEGEWVEVRRRVIEHPLASTAGLYQTRHGWRLVWPLAKPVPVSWGWRRAYEAFLDELGHVALGVSADRGCGDWTRMYRLPRVVREGETGRSSLAMDWARMQPLEWEPACGWVAEEPRVELPPAPELPSDINAARKMKRLLAYIDAFPPAVQGSDGHGQLYQLGAHLYGWAVSESESVELAWRHYNPRCVPPWTSSRKDVADFERQVRAGWKGSKQGWGEKLIDPAYAEVRDVSGPEDDGFSVGFSKEAQATGASPPAADEPELVGDDAPLEGLVERATKNPAAAFETSVLFAVAALRKKDAAEYNRLKFELKAQTDVNMLDFRSAVADAAKEAERRRLAALRKKAIAQAKKQGLPVFERGDHATIAEELKTLLLRQANQVATVFDEGEFHVYAPDLGIYTKRTIAELGTTLAGWSGAPVLGAQDKEPRDLMVNGSTVDGTLKIFEHLCAAPHFFATAPWGVAFKNEFVRWDETMGLVSEPLSPRHRARFGFPFDRQPDACPAQFLRFLQDLFAGDSDAVAKIGFLQEFVGASLLGLATKYAKCLVLLGAGANGKSQFVDIVSALFPDWCKTSVPPQEFKDKDAGAALAGSRINLVSELPSRDILESATFKAVVTGDEITRRRLYERSFKFRPQAAHIFSANQLPHTADTSGGFWRRMAVVRFNRNFQDSPDKKNDIGRKIADQELSGIIEWALDGARRLLARGEGGDYAIPQSTEETVDEWRRDSNPVQQYVDERLRLDGDDWVTAQELYSDFKTWSERNGFRTRSRTTFGREVRACGVEKKMSNGVKYKCRIDRTPYLVQGGAAW